MIRYPLLLIALAGTLGLCDAARGAQATYPHPRPCPDACVPNAGAFGYFPTRWRQWPGEKLLEITNPRAVGLEVLPTPEGQERLPVPTAPRETPLQAPPEGELLPPGGAILPPQGTAPEGALPAEDGLPGLPVEPGSEALPALPEKLPALPENDKPTEESPSPSGGTGTERQWEKHQRATAAVPVETRKLQPRDVVMPLGDDLSSEVGGVEPTAHYADVVREAESGSRSDKGVETAAYAVVESDASVETENGTALGMPPIALGGYCPVDLIRNGRWTQGDLRYTVVHGGWIYRLSGPDPWRQFQADPDAFTPACSGNDPVLAKDEGRLMWGQVRYCAMYHGRLYMFSSAASQARFNEDPRRYAEGK